jgi:hypothetical protein
MVTDVPKCSQGFVDSPQHADDRIVVLLHALSSHFSKSLVPGNGVRGIN